MSLVYSSPPLTTSTGITFTGLVRIFPVTPSSFEPTLNLKFQDGILIEKNNESILPPNAIDLHGTYCSQWIYGDYNQVITSPIICETVIEVTQPTSFQEVWNKSVNGNIYRNSLGELRIENANLKSQIELLQQLITAKDNIIDGLNETITSRENEIQTISTELSLLKIEYDDYINDKETEINNLVTSHQQEIENLNLQIEYLQQNIDTKTQTILDLQEEINLLKSSTYDEKLYDNFMGDMSKNGMTENAYAITPYPVCDVSDEQIDFSVFSDENDKEGIQLADYLEFEKIQKELIARATQIKCETEEKLKKLVDLEMIDQPSTELGNVSDNREKELLDKLCSLTDEDIPDEDEKQSIECPPFLC